MNYLALAVDAARVAERNGRDPMEVMMRELFARQRQIEEHADDVIAAVRRRMPPEPRSGDASA